MPNHIHGIIIIESPDVGAHYPDFIGIPVQNGNEIELDLKYLTSGVYFVVEDFSVKQSVVKILKQ